MSKRNIKNHGKRKPHGKQVSLTPDKGTNVQRKHKDTLFQFIFRDRKKLLQLYNALNQSGYEDEEGLQIITLENVVYLGYKNDISFLVDMILYLAEHQGSWNPNMPLRGVLYFARLYRNYIEENEYNLYGTKRLELPVPRYVIFYNGKEKRPEREILKLSDSFKETEKFRASAEDEEGRYLPPVAMECKALVLNINYGNNKTFLEMCRPLMDYSLFVHMIRENISAGHEPSEAVNLTVDACVSQGILTDVLKGHRREVVAMFLEDYDEELYHKMVRKEGYEEGYEEGHDNGDTQRQKKIGTLCECLVKDNRQKEVIRAMTDFEFQEQLMKEYGI